MTRDDWLDQFVDEIAKLRPHLAYTKLARTLALQKYDPKEHPRDLARQYDKSLRPAGEPPPAKEKEEAREVTGVERKAASAPASTARSCVRPALLK